jgi:hypothetical protein
MPTIPKKVAAAPAVKIDPKKLNKRGNAGKNGKTPPVEEKTEERPIVYPEPTSRFYLDDDPITIEKAKEILGWEEEPKKGTFGDNFLFTLPSGIKVRCTNNETNRPFYPNVSAVLRQDILNKQWKLNGEPIILGKTGIVLNGQHSLVALILAGLELSDPDSPYHETWGIEEPYFVKLVVYGISEDDATVNTMDTCKPRSLADVIYRAHYFKGAAKKDQKQLAKMLSSAIMMLWERSGTFEDAHNVTRNHSVSIEYLNRHPKLLQAVRHIYEEDGGKNDKNKIGKYLNRGYAAAALYLMGSSLSDSDAYYAADHPNESMLNWELWERACEFFVELSGGSKSLKAVPEAIANLLDNQGSVNGAARWAIIVKAWNLYAAKKPVTAEALDLKFDFKDDGYHLVETPYIGGIDVGMEGLPFAEVPEVELEERQTAVQDESKAAKVKTKVKPKLPASLKTKWRKGDTAWTMDGFDEPTFVSLIAEPYQDANGITRVLVNGEGAKREVLVDSLSVSQFEVD